MTRFAELKDLLIGNKLTIAVAESLTCGLVQAKLGEISGASGFLEGGITTYNLEQKVKFLCVDEFHAQSVNCVSKKVAIEMATHVSRIFGSNIGIGTTGYAEPYPEEEVTIPYCFYALYLHLKPSESPTVIANKIQIGGLDRNLTRHYFADTVLSRLILELRERVR
ncbi:MAG: CinA family protein [Cytophagales bacterium]|nr:CinA family protein [Cytophagales bacterium]